MPCLCILMGSVQPPVEKKSTWTGFTFLGYLPPAVLGQLPLFPAGQQLP